MGVILAQTIRLLAMTLKRLHLAALNLVNFCFNLLDTFWQNFSKIDSAGDCCSCFENDTSQKLNIRFFLFCFKTMEVQMGAKICARKDVFRHKR